MRAAQCNAVARGWQGEPTSVPRAGGELRNCLPRHGVGRERREAHDGHDSIGCWIARGHWGRGIASRDVALMLGEFARRPLHATAAGHNLPLIRVLERNGFRIVSCCMTSETTRTLRRETVMLVLE